MALHSFTRPSAHIPPPEALFRWIKADRVRTFSVTAAAALVLCLLILTVVPFTFFSLMIALSLGIVAGSGALIAGLTWAMDRQKSNVAMWDGNESGDRPEDLLIGFEAFKRD